MAREYGLIALLVALQIMFWSRTHDVFPDMSIVPDVPGAQTVQALAMGDEQTLFRLSALRIQNAGDTFGRFTALYQYDFRKLYQWFRLLDVLDNRSNYVPSMASYYFSQTQNTQDVRYVVDYLTEHAHGRAQQKWWWVVQAIYLAGHRLKDQDLALKVSQPLVGLTGVPLWVSQMPAFVHEKRGEMDAALKIIENIVNSSESLTPGELAFMKQFVDERLNRLDQIRSTLEKAQDKVKSDPSHTQQEKPERTN